MAGDWMPIELITPRKPEILNIARIAKIKRHEALGLLIEFWCWISETSVDGYVDGDVSTLVDLIGGTDIFWKAVINEKWLIQEGESRFFIPNFNRWLSNGSKVRLNKNRRQKNWRYSPKSVKNVDGYVDNKEFNSVDNKASTNISTDIDNKASTKPSTTEEKRESYNKEKRVKENYNPLPLLKKMKLDTPEFIKAWERWERKWQDDKKPLKRDEWEILIPQLYNLKDIPFAIETIENSIFVAKQYKKWYFPDKPKIRHNCTNGVGNSDYVSDDEAKKLSLKGA